MTVSFETAPLSPAAWLHVPGRTSTISTGEPSRLVVGHLNTDRLSLDLWRLDLDEYFEATSDWYDYEPSGRPHRSWSLNVDAPLNEPAYTPVDLVEGGGSLEPGIYVIDLEARGVDTARWDHRHVLIASPLNLTLKSAESEILTWATNLETGAPVPGIVLWAYDGDGETIDAAVVDSHGLATFDVAAVSDWRGVTIVGRDPFVLASESWDDGISVWNLGLPYETPSGSRAHVDTDRPIYRPDQTVYFRGIIRDESDAAYQLPSVRSVDLVVHSPEWETVHEETISLDAYGTFSGSIHLPADTPLGDYSLRAHAGDRTFYHTFQVAAYRVPEFEVEVATQLPEAVRGESIPTLVRATYFFGAPLADASVEWNALSEAYQFSPEAFGRYTFSDVDDPWTCWWCWWMPTPTPTPILDWSLHVQRRRRSLDLLVVLVDADADADADPRRNRRHRRCRASALRATTRCRLLVERPGGRSGDRKSSVDRRSDRRGSEWRGSLRPNDPRRTSGQLLRRSRNESIDRTRRGGVLRRRLDSRLGGEPPRWGTPPLHGLPT
jgi:hypothetical protein